MAAAEPRVSPDGRRVCFRRGGRLIVRELEPAAAEERELASGVGAGTEYGDGCFAWASEREIVASFSGELRAIDVSSGHVEPLGLPLPGAEGHLAYNPVSRELAVVETPEGMSVWRRRDAEWAPDASVGGGHTFVYDLDPSGRACTVWSPPAMLWNDSYVLLDGAVVEVPTRPAHCCVPRLSPSGDTLAFLSDASGRLSLWVCAVGSPREPRLLFDDGEAEVAWSSWSSDKPGFAWLDGGARIAVALLRLGVGELAVVDVASGAATRVEGAPGPGVFEGLSSAAAAGGGDSFVCHYAGWDQPGAVLLVSLSADGGTVHVLADAPAPEPLPSVVPERVDRALLYRPAATAAKPWPCLVLVHGGPTGLSAPTYNAFAQAFAAAGWLVAMPNYRGSRGFGRAYREALNGEWGVADVEDVAAVARALAERGEADPQRTCVMGGSAGGFCTLLCLQQHADLFAAGVACCPVTLLEEFGSADGTHLLERHYNATLVGHDAAVLQARSPALHAERVSKPLLVLHGTADTVVPIEHTRRLLAGVPDGVRVESHFYEGKRHVFLDSETTPDAVGRVREFLLSVVGV